MSTPTDNYLRLQETPPAESPPPAGAIDFFNDPTTGNLIRRDSSGVESNVATVGGSVGGNGEQDAGKQVLFNQYGGISLGSPTAINGDGVLVEIRSKSAMGVRSINYRAGGYAYEGSLSTGIPGIAFNTHLTSAEQIGFCVDGIGAGPGSYGLQVQMSASNGPSVLISDDSLNDRISLRGDGIIRFTESAYNATNGTSFYADTATAARLVALPDASGKVAVLPSYADSTAANAAVSVGDVWWDTTLKKARTRMS